MTHHAITLGPVNKILAEARATRELWAASYLLSYISKEIIRKLHDSGVPYDNFLIPTIPGESATAEEKQNSELLKMLNRGDHIKGVGLFPDRIIFKYDDTIELEEITHKVIEELGEKIGEKIGKQASKVTQYLLKYLQCYTLQMEIPDGENAPAIMSPYLDTLELQRNFPQQDERYLNDFFDRVTKSFFIRDAWKKEEESFKTLLEIATIEYQKHPLVEDKLTEFADLRLRNYRTKIHWRDRKAKDDLLDTEVMETLRQHKKEIQLKQAHNYIAIVLADGDNIGSNICKLKGEQYNTFSNLINNTNAAAVDTIKEYGGMNIYAGGDDLLFFAPVVNGNDNIFELLQKLDENFKTAFKDYGTEDKKPALSFGVSITYYKFPMQEAIQSAYNLLFQKAKKEPKNNLALTLQKHSGESFEGVYSMNSESYKIFRELMRDCLKNPNNKLSSIVFKIRENEAMFKAIWEDAKKVENFIDNSFDEDVHKESGIENYLNTIKKLIPQVFKEVHDLADNPKDKNPKDQEAIDKADNKALQTIYGMIRTVSFLISTEIKL